jgi:pimeloyl-ACP methyl ester carboxylesterase
MPLEGPAKLLTRIVYGSIKGVTGLVGAGLDRAIAELAPVLGESERGPEHEAVVAALNGVLGDYLDASGNPLAIEMQLKHDTPDPTRDETRKLLVMVHGSCMNDRQWLRSGHNHGAALASELGYTSAYLHYNSGRHISVNGRELALMLDEVVTSWPTPIDEIAIVAHSMGGLVSRSAVHLAELEALAWRDALRAMVFLGTPHHGAPLERGGNWVDVALGASRYSAPLARLGQIRSAGVTDLRFGNVLDEHWQGRDRFAKGHDSRSPVPLPADVACYAVAGNVGARASDGLVPVNSALGRHSRVDMTLDFPEPHIWIGDGIAHLDLLDGKAVYARLRDWLAPSAS